MTRLGGVFPVMCPSGESGVGLASACWPDQKPVRPVGVTRHSYAVPRFPSPDRHRFVSPNAWLEVGFRMLADQLDYIVGVDPHRDSHATAVVHVISGAIVFESHRGRIESEAAFARLAGAAPIPASSGKTIRYRLDRSGDRKLNRALHMILVTRKRTHPATIAYIERRLQEGKTRREASRCLKRYLARSLYRLLEHGPPMTA